MSYQGAFFVKWILLFILSNQMVFANLHEEDLAGPILEIVNAPEVIKADRFESERSRNGKTQLSLIIEKNSKHQKIKGIISSAELCQKNQTQFKKLISLESNFYHLKSQQGKTYKLEISGECGKSNRLIFEHDSANGQAMGVIDILETAITKFKAIDRLGFWKKRLRVVWPGGGDYYSWGILYITKGHYWDVVGHELGHAIYDMARIGRMGGGSHRIDECYNDALALSEGWASFFSAWLKVDLKDPDAKFEYMVPRRAPLEIEHVPSDVCLGPKNEWRVYAFLWDLIDQNQDNESIDENFAKIWDSTFKKNFSSISKMKKAFEREYDPILVNLVWNQNILGQ